MTRLHIAVFVTASLLMSLASAEPLEPGRSPPGQGQGLRRPPAVYTEAKDLYGGNQAVGPGALKPIDVNKYLTFL